MFVTDIIKAIRSRVSDDFIVGLRFSQWKQHDFNAKLADTSEELEKVIMPPVNAGLDYLHSSMRRFWESEFPNSDENLAYWTKKISNITTIGVGSVGLDTDGIFIFFLPDKYFAVIEFLFFRIEFKSP